MKLKLVSLLLLLPAFVVVLTSCESAGQITDTPTPEVTVTAEVEAESSLMS